MGDGARGDMSGARWFGAPLVLLCTIACEPASPAPAPVHADVESAAALPESRPSKALLPSRQAESAELERSRARELERTLSALSGVHSAHVHLALPVPAPLLGNGEAKPGKASVVLKYASDPAPLGEADVRKLVAGAVQGIDEAQVVVLLRREPLPTVHAASPAPELVRLGPLVVTKSSAPFAKTLIAVSTGTAMTLLTVVIALWLRLRRGHS